MTRTLNSSVIKGVELTISGYKSGYIASAVDVALRLRPAIAANDESPPVPLLSDNSGAIIVLAVYSLGILNAITNPISTEYPHTFNTNLRSAQIFSPSSSKSISSSCCEDVFF